MTFSLPGQPRAEVLLRAALVAPAHAYLLHGPRGTGKRDAARLFAALLLGCDRRRIVPGSHPDLVLIEPEGEHLLVEQIHELSSALRFRPLEAVRRVGIVEQADRLNRDAANAFLKTLEEPPGDVVLILLADDVSRVLPTVRSRCQSIVFPPLSARALAERLQAEGCDAQMAIDIGQRARGDLEFARRLATDQAARAWIVDVEGRVVAALGVAGIAEDAAVRATLAGVKAAGDRAEQQVGLETAAVLERFDKLPASREIDRERKRIEAFGKAAAARRRRRAETDMMRAVIATVHLVLRDVLCVQAGAPERALSSVDSAVLAAIAEEVPRSRLERAIASVDEVRVALSQPVNVSLALAAVFARVAMVRNSERVPA